MRDLTRYNCQAAGKDRKTRPIFTSLTLDNREAAWGWFIKNTFMLSSSTWFINLNITADFVPSWGWRQHSALIGLEDPRTALWLVDGGASYSGGERNDDVDCPGRGVIRFKLYNCWRQHFIIVSLNPHWRADLPRIMSIHSISISSHYIGSIINLHSWF